MTPVLDGVVEAAGAGAGAALPDRGRFARVLLTVLAAATWMLAFGSLAYGAWWVAFTAGGAALVLTLLVALPSLRGEGPQEG